MDTSSPSDKAGGYIYEQVRVGNNQTRFVQYKKGHLLGQGGFASCYLATRTSDGAKFAVKIIRKAEQKEKASSDYGQRKHSTHGHKSSQEQKADRQARILKMCKHQNVVKYQSYIKNSNQFLIIMQYCQNGSFGDMLRQRKQITQIQARYFLVQMITALKYLKQTKIIHRDLKPANYLLTKDLKLKVADFGLAAVVDYSFPKLKNTCGTPNYISPEMLNKQEYSYGVDLWAIGVVLYTMLYGVPPFETKNKDARETYQKIKKCQFNLHNPQVSGEARNLIERILVLNAKDRISLEDIMNHPFICNFDIPPTLSTKYLKKMPQKSFISKYRDKRLRYPTNHALPSNKSQNNSQRQSQRIKNGSESQYNQSNKKLQENTFQRSFQKSQSVKIYGKSRSLAPSQKNSNNKYTQMSSKRANYQINQVKSQMPSKKQPYLIEQPKKSATLSIRNCTKLQNPQQYRTPSLVSQFQIFKKQVNSKPIHLTNIENLYKYQYKTPYKHSPIKNQNQKEQIQVGTSHINNQEKQKNQQHKAILQKTANKKVSVNQEIKASVQIKNNNISPKNKQKRPNFQQKGNYPIVNSQSSSNRQRQSFNHPSFVNIISNCTTRKNNLMNQQKSLSSFSQSSCKSNKKHHTSTINFPLHSCKHNINSNSHNKYKHNHYEIQTQIKTDEQIAPKYKTIKINNQINNYDKNRNYQPLNYQYNNRQIQSEKKQIHNNSRNLIPSNATKTQTQTQKQNNLHRNTSQTNTILNSKIQQESFSKIKNGDQQQQNKQFFEQFYKMFNQRLNSQVKTLTPSGILFKDLYNDNIPQEEIRGQHIQQLEEETQRDYKLNPNSDKLLQQSKNHDKQNCENRINKQGKNTKHLIQKQSSQPQQIYIVQDWMHLLPVQNHMVKMIYCLKQNSNLVKNQAKQPANSQTYIIGVIFRDDSTMVKKIQVSSKLQDNIKSENNQAQNKDKQARSSGKKKSQKSNTKIFKNNKIGQAQTLFFKEFSSIRIENNINKVQQIQKQDKNIRSLTIYYPSIQALPNQSQFLKQFPIQQYQKQLQINIKRICKTQANLFVCQLVHRESVEPEKDALICITKLFENKSVNESSGKKQTKKCTNNAKVQTVPTTLEDPMVRKYTKLYAKQLASPTTIKQYDIKIKLQKLQSAVEHFAKKLNNFQPQGIINQESQKINSFSRKKVKLNEGLSQKNSTNSKKHLKQYKFKKQQIDKIDKQTDINSFCRIVMVKNYYKDLSNDQNNFYFELTDGSRQFSQKPKINWTFKKFLSRINISQSKIYPACSKYNQTIIYFSKFNYGYKFKENKYIKISEDDYYSDSIRQNVVNQIKLRNQQDQNKKCQADKRSIAIPIEMIIGRKLNQGKMKVCQAFNNLIDFY